MNKYVYKFKDSLQYKLLTLLLPLALSGCGQDSAEPEPVAKQPVISTSQLDASQLTVVTSPAARFSNMSVANGVINTTASFSHPAPNHQVTGNITSAFIIADSDGIAKVHLGFDDQQTALLVCDQDCGTESETVVTELETMVTGINPALFSQLAGELTLSLWVEDNLANVAKVATVAINWQPPTISGVVANHDADNETVTLNWQANSQFLRYNVYLSQQRGLTQNNRHLLSGYQNQLALTSTSTVFTDKPATGDYYLLISGVDASGESGFSEEIRLQNGTPTPLPIANNDNFTTNEDTVINGNLLNNDSIADNTALTVSATPFDAPQHGSVTLSDNGDFEYLPNEHFNGQEQFSYQVSSVHGDVAQALVTITILPINDAPTAQADNFTIETASLSVAAPGVLSNDTDIDNPVEELTAELISPPSYGELTFNTDGSFTYQKSASFSSFDNFTYKVTDIAGESSQAEVSITSSDFSGYPPVAANDSYQLNEDTLLQVDGAQGILANDSDRDSTLSEHSLTIVSGPNNGSLQLASDGSFIYQPASDFFGEDSFSYSLTDVSGQSSIAVVSLTVTNVNDAPVALNDHYQLVNDSPTTIPAVIGLLKNDGDIDGDSILIDTNSVVHSNQGILTVNTNGEFTYSPTADFVGIDSFTYQVSDGQLNSTTATVTLNVVDVYAQTDDITQVSINLDDAINDITQQHQVTSATSDSGIVSIEGSQLLFTPNPGFSGIAAIQVTFVVDGETVIVELYIDVTLSAVAPVIVTENVIQQTIDEDFSPTENTIIAIFDATDENVTDTLTWTLDGDANFDINNSTGEVSVIANAQFDYEQTPSYSFTVTVTDSQGLSAQSQFTVNINNINEAPTANTDYLEVMNYGGGIFDFVNNDTDPDGDLLTITSASAAFGVVSVASDGQINYTVADNTVSDTITYTVSDPGGLEAQGQVEVTIKPLPLAGNHDVNNDGSIDLSVVFDDSSQQWQLTFLGHHHITAVQQNGRYFPLEKTKADQAAVTMSSSHIDSAIATVIFNNHHAIKVFGFNDATKEAFIEYDRNGIPLEHTAAALMAQSPLIEVNPAWSGHNAYATASINPSYRNSGAKLTINNNGTGIYSDYGEENGFTWTLSGDKIIATPDNVSINTPELPLWQLHSEGFITDTEYNDYISTNGQNSYNDMVTVNITEAHIELTVQANHFIYFYVQEETKFDYIVPENISGVSGGDSRSILKNPRYARWYPQQTLSQYALTSAELTTQPWMWPLFADNGSQIADKQVDTAQFNADGSGSFTNVARAFTWQLDTAGTLSIDDGLAEYQYQLMMTMGHGKALQITGKDKSTQQSLNMSSLAVPVNGVTDSSISTFVNQGIIHSGIGTLSPERYDDQGIINSVFAYKLENIASAASGANKATRYTSNSSRMLTDWSWQLAGGSIDLITYTTFSPWQSYQVCDPDHTVEPYCQPFIKRNLQVLSIDEEKQQMWVLESQSVIDFQAPINLGDPMTYVESIAPRVNLYQLFPEAQATDDVATLVEDSIDNIIAVTDNDLNNQGQTEGLKVLNVYSDNGWGYGTGDNSITFTPFENFSGNTTVDYMLIDADNGIAVAKVQLEVTNIDDDAPMTYDNTYGISEGYDIIIDVQNFAHDPEGASVTVTSVTQGSHGTVSTDGRFIHYIHDGSETTSDSFTYDVSDGTNTSTGTVFLNVYLMNDPPIAVDDNITLSEGQQVEFNVLTNDSDEETANSALTMSILNSPGFGTLEDLGSGSFKYTHDGSENHVDSFTYQLFDGEQYSNQVFVNFTVNAVNDAPIITSSAPTAATEDVIYNYFAGVNDPDDINNGSDLSWSLTNAPSGMTVDSQGLVSWTPLEGMLTSGTVTLSVADGGENGAVAAQENFTITVTPVNDSPSISSVASTVATEDILYTYTPTSSDPDDINNGSNLTWSLTNAPAGMTVDTFGVINWTPTEGTLTSGTVTLTVSDGGEDSSIPFQEHITITVTPVNDAPAISSAAPTIATEDVLYSYTPTVIDPEDNNNGTDLTWTLTNAPSGMNVDSVGVVTWTPLEGVLTSGTVTLSVADGGEDSAAPAQENFTITVTPVNDSPSISSVASTVATEDILYTYTPTSSDPDDVNNGSNLTWSLTNAPAGMTVDTFGVINWTPTDGVLTSGTVTLTVADGGEDGSIPFQENITITVGAVNDAPVITSTANTTATEDVLYSYTPTVVDPDDVNNGTDLTWSLTNSPAGMTVDMYGVVSWTPTEGVLTSGTVTLSVADGGEDSAAPAQENFTITVTPVNDAPLIGSTAPVSATEDVLYSYTPTVSDPDDTNNGTDLTWNLTNAPSGMVVDSLGVVTWTPTEGVLTSGTVTLSVADGGEDSATSAQENFTITVTPVNDSPVLDAVPTLMPLEEQLAVHTLTATDIENDTLTYTISGGTDQSAFAITAAGVLTFAVQPSFEDYVDSNNDGIIDSPLLVDVTVDDGNTGTDVVNLSVYLTDVPENVEMLMDTSFGYYGVTSFNTRGDTVDWDYLVDATIDDLGNNYVLTNTAAVHSVSKVLADGTLDSSFGYQGTKYITTNNIKDPNITSFTDSGSLIGISLKHVKVDTNNASAHYQKVYLYGYQNTGGDDHPVVIRLNSDGSLDSSFSGDGKYEYLWTGDHSEAVDLLLHSDGFLYLASNSRSTSVIRKQLKIEKLSLAGVISNDGLYDERGAFDLAQIAYDEYITAIFENTNGEVVAVGYIDEGGINNILAARINANDIDASAGNNILQHISKDLGSDPNYNNGNMTNDYITTALQLSPDKAILAGHSNVFSAGETNALVVKFDLDTLLIDNNINCSNPCVPFLTAGYIGKDLSVGTVEKVVDLATNINGDISMVIHIGADSSPQQFFTSQVDSTGLSTTATTAFQATNLTEQTFDGSGSGITNNIMTARILHEPSSVTGATNNLRVFSNYQNNTLLTNEFEIYYRTFTADSDTNNSLLNDELLDNHFDFKRADSMGITASHVSGSNLYITSERENDMYGLGHTINRFDTGSGNLDQTLDNAGQISNYANGAHYNGYLHVDGDPSNYLIALHSELIELANGDILSVSIDMDDMSFASTLVINKVFASNNDYSGFPVASALTSQSVDIFDFHYNSTTNKIALFGSAGGEIASSLRLLVDASNGSLVHEYAQDLFGFAEANKLSTGILLNDDSVVAVGSGSTSAGANHDIFAIKVAANGTLETHFNGATTDKLLFNIDNTTPYHTYKGEVTSTGALVFVASNANQESMLFKIINNAGEYQIDTGFDTIFDGASDANDYGLIDLTSVSGINAMQPNVDIKDLVIDGNDDIYLLGNAFFTMPGISAPFVLKLNGVTAAKDVAFGGYTHPGVFVPFGYADCQKALAPPQKDRLTECDFNYLDSLSIDATGNIFLQGTIIQNGFSNSVIIKFNQQQNDAATPVVYAIEGGGA